jgi:phosphate transport system permease protein
MEIGKKMENVRIKTRVVKSNVMMILSTLAALYGIVFLGWILISVLYHGYQSLNLQFFTQDPVPPGMPGGGLKMAFIGQFLITVVAALIGTPIGIMAGIFLAEYGRGTWWAMFVRNLSDIVISMPAIVIGAAVYVILVAPLHSFNGLSGSVALSILSLPYITIATDEMLKLVPKEMREAAYALGAYKHYVIRKVTMRAAKTGILTGVILGLARMAGEAAPLLFTSFNNDHTTFNLLKPMATLTITIFIYATGPYHEWHEQAWAAGFVLTFGVLIAVIIAKFLVHGGSFTAPFMYVARRIAKINKG